jgi:ELWxxDGT repeat protein
MRRPASLGRSLAAVVALAITASAAAQAPYLVKDITSTRISPDPVSLETAGSFVFFVATDAPGVQGIYRTDGTGTGTIRLATVVPTRAVVDDPYEITRVGNLVFFINLGSAGAELWRSDGTPAGTFALAAFPAGSPARMTDVGGRLFFAGYGLRALCGRLYFAASDPAAGAGSGAATGRLPAPSASTT